MISYSKILVPLLSVVLLASCGEKKDDPERDLTVVRFNFVNACSFYAGSKNADFCGCAFDEIRETFGDETVIKLIDVSEESELDDPDDITTFRSMHEFMAATPEGACKHLVVHDKEKDSDKKSFFRRLVE